MPAALELRPVEQVERLQQRRALAPGAAAIDVDVAEPRMNRRLDLGMVFGEILGAQEPAILLLEAHDRSGDVAAIEGVVRRCQPGRAPAAAMRALLVDHV